MQIFYILYFFGRGNMGDGEIFVIRRCNKN